MANWQGVARTNYFNVNDPDAFKARMTEIAENAGSGGIRLLEGDDQTFGLIADEGNWPDCIERDVGDDAEVRMESESIDMVAEVASFLRADSIAVFMEAGYEGERYVSGQSIAVNSEGEILEVNLNDIYSLAEAKWGNTPGPVQY